MIWVDYRFKKPGISQDVKKMIRKRYLEFVVLYSLFELPTLIITAPLF